MTDWTVMNLSSSISISLKDRPSESMPLSYKLQQRNPDGVRRFVTSVIVKANHVLSLLFKRSSRMVIGTVQRGTHSARPLYQETLDPISPSNENL